MHEECMLTHLLIVCMFPCIPESRFCTSSESFYHSLCHAHSQVLINITCECKHVLFCISPWVLSEVIQCLRSSRQHTIHDRNARDMRHVEFWNTHGTSGVLQFLRVQMIFPESGFYMVPKYPSKLLSSFCEADATLILSNDGGVFPHWEKCTLVNCLYVPAFAVHSGRVEASSPHLERSASSMSCSSP